MLSGNRCGHDPDAPRLEVARPGVGRLPPILHWACERVRAFYGAPTRLGTLAYRLPRRSRRGLHSAIRMMRSERREGCVALLEAIVYRTELASGLVGYPMKQGFYCLTLDALAEDAGLSLSRAKEAHHDLVHAGLLQSTPRHRRVGDRFLGAASVRQLTRAFWNALGLGLQLQQEAKKASKRLQRRAAQDACRVADLMNVKLGRARERQRSPAPSASAPRDPVSIWLGYQPLDIRQWLQRRAFEISRAGPSRFESYRRAATELGIRGPAPVAP